MRKERPPKWLSTTKKERKHDPAVDAAVVDAARISVVEAREPSLCVAVRLSYANQSRCRPS